MQNHQSIYIPEGGNPLSLGQQSYIQNIQEPPIQEKQLPPPPPNKNFNSDDSSILNIETENSRQHWGEAPRVQVRRNNKQRIVLKDGKHLVLECPIPTDLFGNIPRNDSKEFTHMRYTACTSGPDDFEQKGFSLRQAEFSPPRHTELFIVLTMYNEDKGLLARTFHGVVKNIAHLCSRKKSKVWGDEGWKKIVVCIVADGRENIEQSALAYLAALGAYQYGVVVGKVKEETVNAHIFEYTTQISIDHSMSFKTFGEDSDVVPVQVLFCLKEENAKKINSHRWFFNAFGPILKPNICVLIDVGTEPGPKSIYHLWKAFDVDAGVAGACGEIVTMKGKGWRKLLNPIVAAQNFEYKMSNILDKPFESVFGYISVLPGAFSAYRYIALQSTFNDKNEEEGPLVSYFKGEIDDKKNEDKKKENMFIANMYLAEDRILCFELVAKRKCSWLLHYVKSSQAETDVPEDVTGLIRQRRRWLNGSFFASFYAISHFYYISRSDHSIGRKMFLYIEMAYQAFNLIFAWFAIALSTPSPDAPWDPKVGRHRIQGSNKAYTISIIFFGLIMIYMLFAAFWLTIKGIDVGVASLGGNPDFKTTATAKAVLGNTTFRNIILSLVSTYGLYLIASLMMFDPWHMFTCILQYIILLPFYVVILNIYAFCNIHDVSWGNRPETAKKLKEKATDVESTSGVPTVEVAFPEDVNVVYQAAVQEIRRKPSKDVTIATLNQKREDSRKSFRTKVVLSWVFSNIVLITVISNLGNSQQSVIDIYLAIVLWSVAGLAGFRFFGTLTYLLFRLFTDPNALNCKK
ncbi:11619_t:CDS:2 [Cetraspora pellucida]|uniref:11619_t:CDS:1 n=1 Tax=Cetraspora pellucida TaxID=1433469 RepID=A0ACA9L272_9GLOM|nr:11619_t:CDS:2 [Cetraspora pellucida]